MAEATPAALPGTGLPQSDVGNSMGEPVYSIPRPLTQFGRKISIYTKQHKFMTFGIAPVGLFLNTVNPVAQSYFITTALAELPVHMPVLYLNQSEFDLIPPGSRVVELNVIVTYRGTVVQFETASTTTALATLNQINDIHVAYALNKTGQGQNISYTSFPAATPMIPGGIARPKYDAIPNYVGMVEDYYGQTNNGPNFHNNIPHSQLGRQTFLYNYWALSARGGTTAAALTQTGGWPSLADKIDQMDGRTVINQVVARYNYKPKIAPIKAPLHTIGHGLPWLHTPGNPLNVAVGGNLPAVRRAAMSMLPPSSVGVHASISEISDVVTNEIPTQPTMNIFSPIEKSQMMRSGFWGEHVPHVQPSLHIGNQPVPSLTTASLLTTSPGFGTWTNTRAYWDVQCTMVVQEHQPTAYPHAAAANVPIGDQLVWVNDNVKPAVNVDPRNDGATMAGLYTDQHVGLA